MKKELGSALPLAYAIVEAIARDELAHAPVENAPLRARLLHDLITIKESDPKEFLETYRVLKGILDDAIYEIEYAIDKKEEKNE